MTLEKITRNEMKRIENEVRDAFIMMGFGTFGIVMITFVAFYFEANTKRYEISQTNTSYKIEAVKNRDTQINVYENSKYVKTCTIQRSKKQFMPLVKGGYDKILERRTEEYILPTEKELNDCYNPNQIHQ